MKLFLKHNKTDHYPPHSVTLYVKLTKSIFVALSSIVQNHHYEQQKQLLSHLPMLLHPLPLHGTSVCSVTSLGSHWLGLEDTLQYGASKAVPWIVQVEILTVNKRKGFLVLLFSREQQTYLTFDAHNPQCQLLLWLLKILLLTVSIIEPQNNH